MNEDLVRVYIAGQDYKALLVKQMLADNDIESFILNKKDSSYSFGDIEVYVNRDEVIRAKRLISEFEEQ